MKKAFAVMLIAATAYGAKVHAAPRELALRWERGTCVHQASTSQTVEAAYGTNLLALTFSGTATYNFYSPPLALPTALTTRDKGGGTIFMNNVSPSHANDFVVKGRMQ